MIVDMDDLQYEICKEFKDYSYVNNPNSWEMNPELIPDDTAIPSWWYDETSGLQDWNDN